MPFRDYAGTEFVPFLLPIIPKGAPLSPTKTKLTPERIGKIPGQLFNDGWAGFKNWQHNITRSEVLPAFAAFYRDQPCETIGINSKILLASDSDFDNPVVRDIVIEEYVKRFGEAPIRTRPNSFKILIPLRLAKGSQVVTKIRRVFTDPWGTVGALEVLGRGEQWVMEGMHPSGVQLEWLNGQRPVDLGWDKIPEATFEQVHEFVEAVSQELIKIGFTPTKISLSRGGALAGGYKIGPNHPELCPDLDMLRDVLKILPCDHPEWDLYDDWMRAVAAIKTACGGDEGFYAETFEPWASQVPDNLVEYGFIRAKWGSFTDTAIGWLWLCQIAHDHGYFGDVIGPGGFEKLPEEEGKPDGPRAATLNRALERRLVGEFAAERGRKTHVFVPAGRSGSFKRYESGIWVPDHTILDDVGTVCEAEAQRIINRPDTSAAALRRADSLMGVRTAENIVRGLRAHPRIVALPEEFDERDLIIGVPGGFVDEEGRLRDPDPGMMLTRHMRFRPDWSRQPELWIEMIRRLTNRDQDEFEAMRRAHGYTMSGRGCEQAMFFIYGRQGGEGKTQVLEALAGAMASYAMHAEIETFMDVRGYRRSFDLRELQGFWFVYGAETKAGMSWHEQRMKLVTGGEMIRAEGKFVHGLEFRPRFGLWFAGNNIPRFRDVDGAIRRRLFIFDCLMSRRTRTSGATPNMCSRAKART
jgi:hypothetical protein